MKGREQMKPKVTRELVSGEDGRLGIKQMGVTRPIWLADSASYDERLVEFWHCIAWVKT